VFAANQHSERPIFICVMAVLTYVYITLWVSTALHTDFSTASSIVSSFFGVLIFGSAAVWCLRTLPPLVPAMIGLTLWSVLWTVLQCWAASTTFLIGVPPDNIAGWLTMGSAHELVRISSLLVFAIGWYIFQWLRCVLASF
jgi:hypothetical protein